jgi:hypothetical protein
MPVAHGHKTPGLESGAGQPQLEGAGLLLGEAPNRGSASYNRVMMLNFSGTGAGNEFRQRSASDAGEWKIDNIGVAKQVIQEGLNRLQRVGSAKLEKHYSHTPYFIYHPPRSLGKQAMLLKLGRVRQMGRYYEVV